MSRAGRIRLLVCVLALLLLEGLCRSGLISAFTLPAPSVLATGTVDALGSGKFNVSIAVTLRDVAISIVLAMLVGVALAALIQPLGRLRRILEPLFATYYAVPMYAFYPLLIVLLGLGDAPKIAIGFLLAVMAVIINTLNGLDRLPRVLVKVARVHRLSAIRAAWRIHLPFAAPYIFTGFKLAVAYAFVGVIGAEFITSNRGVGYEIAFAYNNFDNKTMYAMILVTVALVLTVNLSLYTWERRLQARRQRDGSR